MADWWQGGGESNGPDAATLLAAGWHYRTDREEWEPPAGWIYDPTSTMQYRPAQPLQGSVASAVEEATARSRPWFYKPQASEEELRRLATLSPYTVARVVEGGEGQRTEYTAYDPAGQAKMLLAQPAKVSADYIRTNYPSLAGLPANVLNQMGADWRTAYAHLQKMPEQSASGWSGGREGIVPLPVRIEGGRPVLSTGGGGELFTEALPYVTYSPEYGLAVPKAGVRPYQEGFSWVSMAPSLMLSAAMGPLAGAFGGGIAGTAAAGALTGAASAALQGGDITKGALTGGITGGLGAAAAPALNSAVSAAGLTGAAADAVKAGAMAAGNAALTGSDPLQAALMAATGAGVSSAVGSLDLVKELDPNVAKAVTAAASGAARAAAAGGDPIQAAVGSAINSSTNAALGSLQDLASGLGPDTPSVPIAEWDDVTPFETPTESWIDRGMLGQPTDWDTYDLLEALRQQEEDQAGMQSEILGYDPRILEALGGADMGQENLQRLLSQTGTGGVSVNLGRALSGTGAVTEKAPSPEPLAAAPQTAPQVRGQGFGDLITMLGLLSNQAPVQAPAPTPVADIKYLYDIGGKSIFAPTHGQGGMGTPYAEGGTVEDLMKILKG